MHCQTAGYAQTSRLGQRTLYWHVWNTTQRTNTKCLAYMMDHNIAEGRRTRAAIRMAQLAGPTRPALHWNRRIRFYCPALEFAVCQNSVFDGGWPIEVRVYDSRLRPAPPMILWGAPDLANPQYRLLLLFHAEAMVRAPGFS